MKNMENYDFRDIVESVRERYDIAEVVSRYVRLTHANKGLCPFHEERTPSFSVNTKGQYFYCFGCGKGGDVFKFLELYEKKSFIEVLKELADKAGIKISDVSPDCQRHIDEERTIRDVLRETVEFYHGHITQEASDYLTKKRGIEVETISKFKIGYANGDLKEYLLKDRDFSLDVCIKAGILKKREDGTVKDYFHNRIIFPNFRHGQVVHMSGRGLGDNEPKYLHLPGEIKYLYNEDALYEKEVYIVEGILDCLSAMQRGYPAIAVLGTSNFKPEYLQKFSHCERIYICLDGDEAGIKGSLKIGNIIGDKARISTLPVGMDINDYFNNYSKDDFDKLVAYSKDIIKYELSFIPPDTDKTELPQRLEPILKKLSGMEKAKIEAYLNYEIKTCFKLKKEDIDGYRDIVMKCRKADMRVNGSGAEDEEVKPVYTALFEGLIDIVEKDGKPVFLIKEDSKLFVVSSVKKEGLLYLPPPKEQIPWLIPRGEEILKLYEIQSKKSDEECDKELYDELLSYHKSVSELPEDGYYDLIAAWDLHTYLLESTEYSPIICLFAVPERGKSRTGKGMIHVAFRGIHVESLRDAYLVRVANDLGASLFFDVKDIWKKAENNGSEDILLHRFEKGAKVPRVLFPDKGAHRDIVYYSIFGPTIISTNEGIHRILETRAIPINMPGKSKDWGQFLLTGWRYNINEYLNGRIYLDWRQRFGVAEGFGTNYSPKDLGKGDFKFYYTQERTKELAESTPAEFQRYFIRWKHKWDIDEQTNFTAQYYKITDSKKMVLDQTANILKDYFFREYEKDTEPPSFLTFHHSFSYSSMDFFMQKRANRWYSSGYLERLPEITYSLPSIEVIGTPFTFSNSTSIGNYNKKNTSTLTPAANDTNPDTHVNRLDTTNKFSLPVKIMFFNLTPFVSNRETFYDKDVNSKSIPPRTVFSSGTDLSTKFYRVFNVKSSPFGMEINGLRHIITPTIGYSYSHEPTISNTRLRQIDGVDSATRSNSASLSLSNKLQTKRKGLSVDFVDFLISSNYTFKPKTGDKRGSNLSSILFELKVLPYSWMTINADTTYNRSGNRSNEAYRHLSSVNYDVIFDIGTDRKISLGQRYIRKGTNYVTWDLYWRLNPKWKFSFYQSRNIGHDPGSKRGLREQQYGISRDLHCWEVEFFMNQKRGVGESLWLTFRLKAFPELEFEYDQSYHAPKPGSQFNP